MNVKRCFFQACLRFPLITGADQNRRSGLWQLHLLCTHLCFCQSRACLSDLQEHGCRGPASRLWLRRGPTREAAFSRWREVSTQPSWWETCRETWGFRPLHFYWTLLISNLHFQTFVFKVRYSRTQLTRLCLESRVDLDADLNERAVTPTRCCLWPLVCWCSVLCQGLWGVLSVSKGFNFPLPQFASRFICSPHFAFAQYIQITGNSITLLNLLQSPPFFKSPRLRLSQLCLSWFPWGESQTSLKFSKLSLKNNALESIKVEATVPPSGHEASLQNSYLNLFSIFFDPRFLFYRGRKSLGAPLAGL